MFLIAALFGLVIAIKIIFMEQGTVYGSDLYGFSVDSEGNLYLGKLERIEVYDGQKLVRTITQPKEFYFVINEDQLYIATPYEYEVKVYDLAGNYIMDSDIPYEEIKEISTSKRIICKGEKYCLEKHHGLLPYEIIRGDNTTIYKMTMLDFLFSGIRFAVIIGPIAIALSIMTIYVWAKNGFRRNIFW